MQRSAAMRIPPALVGAVVAGLFTASACQRATGESRPAASAKAAAGAGASTAARAGGKGFSAATFRKPSPAQLKRRLTPLQFRVTQQEGTERPFANAYWNHKAEGIYVDVVSGEPLFSSRDKFKSGTGWPSFTRPLEPKHIVKREDTRLWVKRVEVRSRHADSHLGHVFDDGPPPTGLRYCINSAALRFIPKERLAAEGYGRYLALFTKK